MQTQGVSDFMAIHYFPVLFARRICSKIGNKCSKTTKDLGKYIEVTLVVYQGLVGQGLEDYLYWLF